MMCCSDIDHLTRILVLCGTPGKETVAKITSEEVMAFSCVSIKGSQIHLRVLKLKQLGCLVRDNLINMSLSCGQRVVMNNVKSQKSLYEILLLQSWNVFFLVPLSDTEH